MVTMRTSYIYIIVTLVIFTILSIIEIVAYADDGTLPDVTMTQFPATTVTYSYTDANLPPMDVVPHPTDATFLYNKIYIGNTSDFYEKLL